MTAPLNHKIKELNASYYPQRVFTSPQWLVLGVNNICNLHCRMCDVGVNYIQSNFYENLMGSTPLQMPLELLKKIVDQTARYYPSAKLGFAFTEPLIYLHLDESLQYAHANNLYTTITTNGLGLKKWAGRLHAAGLNELFLSLDGPENVHNMIRGNEHSYRLALEGVEALVTQSNNIGISVFCVITEWNLGCLNEFLTNLNHLPLKKVGFMHMNFTTAAVAEQHNLHFGNQYPATVSNVSDVNMKALNLLQMAEEIHEIKSKSWHFPVEFSPDLDGLERLKVFYHQPEIFIGKRCMDIFNSIMIKSNGDVIPAHGRCYNIKTGNLYESNLKKIWNSSLLAQFRTTVAKNGGLLPACSRCCSSFSG